MFVTFSAVVIQKVEFMIQLVLNFMMEISIEGKKTHGHKTMSHIWNKHNKLFCWTSNVFLSYAKHLKRIFSMSIMPDYTED